MSKRIEAKNLDIFYGDFKAVEDVSMVIEPRAVGKTGHRVGPRQDLHAVGQFGIGLRFPELPEIDLQLVERPDEAPMGAGESASVPSAAAFANAIFDATGVRMREVPFTPSRVLAALKNAPTASAANAAASAASK